LPAHFSIGAEPMPRDLTGACALLNKAAADAFAVSLHAGKDDA
jgi:hypothetical protein